MEGKKFNLEDRLVDYTCLMIDVVESLPNTRTGNYIAGQMIRSCHSPTFNYGEVQAAESRADFLHKLGIVLKELKECRVGLKVIRKKQLILKKELLDKAFSETEQLVAIIAKSIDTAKRNKLVNKTLEY